MFFCNKKRDPELRFRKPGLIVPVSESLAYVRVCEWARDPNEYPRPNPVTLERAKEHAIRLGDPYILTKIQECVNHNRQIDETPTPKLPGSTARAEREAEDITDRVRKADRGRKPTQPYSLSMTSKEEEMDLELDNLLWELEEEGI